MTFAKNLLAPQREIHPFNVVKDFEEALAEYTGAPYAVAVNSCTAALLLAVACSLTWDRRARLGLPTIAQAKPEIEIPKRTYVGVPMSIIHAGGRPTFRDEDWRGAYRLDPLPVWDAARRMRRGMYTETSRCVTDAMVCVSFHWSKILGIEQGGAILCYDEYAADWLKRARFDGRREGVAPADDTFDMLGWHCYMSPEVAAAGLVRLARLPDWNEDLPNDPYPDLSTHEVFR